MGQAWAAPPASLETGEKLKLGAGGRVLNKLGQGPRPLSSTRGLSCILHRDPAAEELREPSCLPAAHPGICRQITSRSLKRKR